MKCEGILTEAKTFLTAKCDHVTIAEAGERVFVMLYNGRQTDSLDSLRLVRYHQKLSCGNMQVQAKVLPPTSSADRYNSYRVYFQVQEWANLGEVSVLLPEDWGWEFRQSQLMPVTTDISAAHHLMQLQKGLLVRKV